MDNILPVFMDLLPVWVMKSMLDFCCVNLFKNQMDFVALHPVVWANRGGKQKKKEKKSQKHIEGRIKSALQYDL